MRSFKETFVAVNLPPIGGGSELPRCPDWLGFTVAASNSWPANVVESEKMDTIMTKNVLFIEHRCFKNPADVRQPRRMCVRARGRRVRSYLHQTACRLM